MSTFVLTLEPRPLIRLFMPQSGGTGQEVAEVERHLDQYWNEYRQSLAMTYREAALDDTFRALAKQWRDATRFQSVVAQSTSHPAYRAIVQLGEEVVPLLLRELRQQPEPWFVALREITGVDPVRPEYRGDMRAIANAWLRWGHDSGLI